MDYSTIQNAESKEVVQALEQLIEPLLVPGETVVIGVPATWRERAEPASVGTFQGAIIGTTLSVIFLYKEVKRQSFDDLDKIIAFPKDSVLRAQRVRTVLTSTMGRKFYAPKPNSHHVEITQIDGGVFSFYLLQQHQSDLLKYLEQK